MHRSVQQPFRVDDVTQLAPHHLVTLIDDIKPFFFRPSLYFPIHSLSSQRQKAENTMPKIDVNKVAEILKRNQLDPAIMRKVIEEMNIAVQPDPGEEEKLPPVKKQFVFMISDPEGKLPDNDFTGWVLQIPESESPASLSERVHRAAYDFNATKKGQLLPVTTVGDTMESVPARFFKDAECWVKTKEPVYVVKTNNEIPTDDLQVEKGDPLGSEDDD